jgi:hypothetical protein
LLTVSFISYSQSAKVIQSIIGGWTSVENSAQSITLNFIDSSKLAITTETNVNVTCRYQIVINSSFLKILIFPESNTSSPLYSGLIELVELDKMKIQLFPGEILPNEFTDSKEFPVEIYKRAKTN